MRTLRVTRDYTAFAEGYLKLTCDCGFTEYAKEGEGAFGIGEGHLRSKHAKGGIMSFSPTRYKPTRQWRVEDVATTEILKEDYYNPHSAA
jgi:hypothetical protein